MMKIPSFPNMKSSSNLKYHSVTDNTDGLCVTRYSPSNEFLVLDGAAALSFCGLAHFNAGNHKLAKRLYKRAIKIMKRLKTPRRELTLGIAIICSYKAEAHIALKEWKAAITLYKEVIYVFYDVLQEKDIRFINALKRLAFAMKQSDLSHEALIDTTSFDDFWGEMGEMANLKSNIQDEMSEIQLLEEELEKESAYL